MLRTILLPSIIRDQQLLRNTGNLLRSKDIFNNLNCKCTALQRVNHFHPPNIDSNYRKYSSLSYPTDIYVGTR